MALEELMVTLDHVITNMAGQDDLQTRTWTTDLAQFEDGQRVEINTETFEWWYFDTIMDDGSTCVVTFLNKIPFISGPLRPILQLNINTPEGRYFQEELVFPQYSSSTKGCDVSMGPNWVKGDLHTYELHAEKGDDLCVDLQLEGVVPGWRTGPYLPPQEAARQWLGEQIVIPAGTVQGTLAYEGASHAVKGTCYHDHQWGGVQAAAPGEMKVSSWYWGRARIGNHSIVFAQVLGSDGSGPAVPVGALFMFARGTGITYDENPAALSVTPCAEGIGVEWQSNEGTVRLDLPAPQEIARFNDGKYLRYLSPAVLTSNFAGETFTGKGNAIWEINTF